MEYNRKLSSKSSWRTFQLKKYVCHSKFLTPKQAYIFIKCFFTTFEIFLCGTHINYTLEIIMRVIRMISKKFRQVNECSKIASKKAFAVLPRDELQNVVSKLTLSSADHTFGLVSQFPFSMSSRQTLRSFSLYVGANLE